MRKTATPNRLISESSPYLKQHAYNPVDWYAWSQEALDRAKREQKPIFLSIGYSACHWCHVMERESFEDEETAKLMNERFINIKVDREERQDLDHIYMSAVQVMTQHGGWPMSVFLTPDLQPFYGGTYFPLEDRMGMPSFKKVLSGVSNAWISRKEEVLRSADELAKALEQLNQSNPDKTKRPLSFAWTDKAVEGLAKAFDPRYGGFGSSPKFFHTMELRLLLRHYQRTRDSQSLSMVKTTLQHLAQGGIYDQIGGGFHRYSTDAQWLVPHFEKMLYDNALLAEVYLEAYQLEKEEEYARIARETLNFVLREMTHAEGGFYSTLDADSEGEEGKFYVWSLEEIFSELDREVAAQFCQIFNVSKSGNWEEKNILHRDKSLKEWAKAFQGEEAWIESTLALAQRKLLAVRQRRVRPARDEKILVSWNGLMIHAMALGFQILEDSRYLEAAKNAATLILDRMRTSENRLLHVYKDGQAKLGAYLDDYANFIHGLITLYESDFELKWLEEAEGLMRRLIGDFWDAESGTFFFTAKDHEKLFLRPKEVYDGALPSGTSMAITALARLGRLTADTKLIATAEEAIHSLSPLLENTAGSLAQTLNALDLLLNEPCEWVLVASGDSQDSEVVLRLLRERFAPSKVVLFLEPQNKQANHPLLKSQLANKKAIEGRTTLYRCHNFSCQAPWVGLEAIRDGLLNQ